MVEPHAEQAETLIAQDHNVHALDQSEEKQAVMEVTRLVTETEIDHGNANECPTEGLEPTAEALEANATTDEVQDASRAQPGSDLAINIMSHMEISRLIANVVKRMQEEGAQSGVSTHNLFHMENLLKQIVTNQNTITINQNSLLRNQQAIIQKVDVLNSFLMTGIGEGDARISEKLTSNIKSNMQGTRPTMGSPRAAIKRNIGMDGTLALVQAAEHVGMISGSPMSVSQTLNGVTTTTVIAQEGGVDGEPRTSGDEEQPGFGSPSQGGPDLSTISPQAIYLTTGSLSPEQLLHHQSKPGEVNEVTLVRLKARSQSVGNFAVHLVREMFKNHELYSKNVSGTRNKEKLDPERVNKIKKYVFELFPTTEMMEEKVWSDCRKAIDEFLRRPNKRKNQDRLSTDGLEQFGLKKDKLNDTPVMGTP